MQGPVFGFAVSGTITGNIVNQHFISGKDWLSGGAFGFEGSLLCSVIEVVLILIFYLYYRKRRSLSLHA